MWEERELEIFWSEIFELIYELTGERVPIFVYYIDTTPNKTEMNRSFLLQAKLSRWRGTQRSLSILCLKEISGPRNSDTQRKIKPRKSF